jgi:hypothetical protein
MKLSIELSRLDNVCWQHKVGRRVTQIDKAWNFQVGDEVLLRLKPTKCCEIFNIKGKHTPW